MSDEADHASPWQAYGFEAAVCAALVALALLWRENPVFDYPEIYYALLATLGANLGAGVALRRKWSVSWVTALAALGNSALITAVLAYSGGPESNLWVLYLLPIYTACLVLNGREAAWVAAGVIAFDLTFHLLAKPQLDSVDRFRVSVQAAVLALGGGALWRLVSRQRLAQRKLGAERARLEALAREMVEAERGSGALLHDLRTPLAILHGTVDLLEGQERPVEVSPEDLGRLRRAVDRCLALLDRRSSAPEPGR